MKKRALDFLEKYYGYKSFRKGQEKIILSIVNNEDVLAIMPTGGGKSICYQIPALLLDGLTIVISPLISLMKDQVDAIKTMGIQAAYINSSLSAIELNEIYDNIRSKKYKILYIAPERLDSLEFFKIMNENTITQVAIDEAHCVSQWGHDFRPSYRRIPSFIRSLSKRPIITAFTATASKEVRNDIIKLLELSNPKVFITGFDRENLSINIIKEADKRNYLLNYINENKDKSGIIYAVTRKEVDSIYDILKRNEFSVGKYHAGLSDSTRNKSQEEFINDNINIMVATNAFGMGIDKPNVRYVIHFNMPQNIEEYYQEIGRAGRDGEKSDCILLFSQGDLHTQKYLIEVSTENLERKATQYKKLQEIMDLIYTNKCYREKILEYFGEVYNSPCNNCSNCLNEGDITDKTLDTQKVLSCIYRMKRNYGLGMLVDVLRGSKNKKVLEQKFDKLTTYGIMKDYSQDELKSFINTLISHGYLELIEGTYPLLQLNNKSIKVLKGEEKVEFKEFKVKSFIKLEDSDLFLVLKKLRKEIAKEENIPPYVIFGDGTLKEMSLKYPRTKEEALKISGIGEVKYLKYGEIFIKVISEYVEENNINVCKLGIIDESTIPYNVSTDYELLNLLLEFREKLSEKYNILSYSIISKNTLKEISGRYPLSKDQLLDIAGMGRVKVDKYGEDILNIVNLYVRNNNIEPIWKEKKRRRLVLDGDGRSNEEKVMDMISEKVKIKDIVSEVEVSISTILGYVSEHINNGEKIDIYFDLNEYYTEEEKELILHACADVGRDKVSLIKKKIPEYIKYESIRAVLLDEQLNLK